ncbi:MAG TPA: response regulator [Candidatus Eisenbacteria bacterium]|nr:response regulator [Candidatus Eisenbacteria bacterium]
MSASVLIVDDEQLLVRTLSSVLSEYGYRITVAGSAEEAAPRIFGQERFDLILLDNRLPGESGIDLMRRIREQAVRSKVILMTAYGTAEVRRQVERLEVDHYLTKPFDLGVVVEEVRALIGPVVPVPTVSELNPT